jgi:hypothetical protein
VLPLKTSAGVIGLQVPIIGYVNYPQSSFGPLIRQVIGTVLANIVTASFRLLGRLVGGGDRESADVRCRSGRSALSPPEQETCRRGQLCEPASTRPGKVRLPWPISC